ncbi:hypothetical protein C4D60_Mb05t24360 [Musa balbisiana]|uniref:Protein POLYCHOME n=1 Tax=Musa balbisiana TaxID=52838 RepID=A0A4S8JYK8_MUSBA|nr:hypothetical protein C4D60_Mb05t24360 [Musa balbisiana]
MNQGLGTMVDVREGFWIRRVAFPDAVVRSRSRREQSLVFTTDDKENIPPSLVVTARRRVGRRKSPLPSWYPRTPLRDVTVVVNALERRRMRATATRVKRRNRNREMKEPDQTSLGEALSSDVSDALYVSPIGHSLQSPSSGLVSVSTTDPSTEDMRPTEFEEKLQSTIAEMERLVLRNLKRSPEPHAKKKPTRTLLSMR